MKSYFNINIIIIYNSVLTHTICNVVDMISIATKLLKCIVFRVFSFLYQKKAIDDLNRKVGSCTLRRGEC